MSWENIEKARCYVGKANMSARPEFYSGRDAMKCDLNSNQLEIIYTQIVEGFGEDAGKNFIEMVIDIKVLTATRFLNSLYALAGNGWVWVNQEQSNISASNMGEAFGTLMGVLGSRGWDETDCIKVPFLLNHNVKYKMVRDERNNDGGWSYRAKYEFESVLNKKKNVSTPKRTEHKYREMY